MRTERHGGALRFDVNVSMLFPDTPTFARPAAAAANGFDAIEMWWPFDVPNPHHRDIEALVESISGAGVRLVLLNLFLGDPGLGQHGLLSLPRQRTSFRDNVDVVAGIVRRLGVSVVNAHFGNLADETLANDARQVAIANLAWAAPRVSAAGASLVVEALNPYDFPRYGLHRVADALSLARQATEASGTHVRILFDLYHVERTEGQAASLLARHASDIGHVQIADVPGRGRPGTGRLDFQGVFAVLRQVGYGGFVGLEYRPSEDDHDTFGWLPARERRVMSGP